jgi:D-3-phosphoglycerate dehydrogenase
MAAIPARLAQAVIAAEQSHLTTPAVAALQAAGVNVRVLPPGWPLKREAAANVSTTPALEAEVLLVGGASLDAKVISWLPKVRFIIKCGVGTDNIDIDTLGRRGIRLANIPDYCISEVADHTVLLLLAATKHLGSYLDALKRGDWSPRTPAPPVRRLQGRTLAIIGFGRIGSQVATRALALGLRVVAASPRLDTWARGRSDVTPVTLDAAIRHSDIISLHCALTPATRHILNRERFAEMRRGVVIINTSRGACIDLDALDEAIQSGVVDAAGLDVLDGEPQPNLDHPVLRRPNVFVTPHIAYYSIEAIQELGARAADLVVEYFAEEKLAPS